MEKELSMENLKFTKRQKGKDINIC